MPAVDTANEIILARGMRTLRGGFEAFGKIKQGGLKCQDSVLQISNYAVLLTYLLTTYLLTYLFTTMTDTSLDAAAAVPTHERTIG